MSVLHLEPIHPRTRKSEILAFCHKAGDIDRRQIGLIELQGGQVSIEIPERWEARLINALDGAQFQHHRVRAWATGSETDGTGEENHFQRLARLLNLESDAEAQQASENLERFSPQEAEKTGNSLIDLAIDEEHSGLGGRFILTLVKRNRSVSLPWTRLGVGAPVLLSAQGDSDYSVRGVICEKRQRFIRVAINEMTEEDVQTWRIDRSNDEVARQRQQSALGRVQSARGDRLAELRRIMLGERPPSFSESKDFQPLSPSLNPSQLEAIEHALSARDFALIHGPPGTGKTTVVIELIRHAVLRGEKVLASAPSNLAVDNILERLIASGEKAVRLGHPARILQELREYSLDFLVEKNEHRLLAKDLRREAMLLQRKAQKFHRAKPVPGSRKDLWDQINAIRDDARQLERQAIENVLDSADILLATTTGLDSEILGQRQFDLAVVDEACQSTEPGCWIPILRSRRVVLAGDHCQLPPTVVSREAADEGFGRSLFERLFDTCGSDVTRRLTTQYRMHAAIQDFSSMEFYDAELEADAAVRDHLLCELAGVEQKSLTQQPVHFIDTAGAGYEEETEPNGESRLNPQEAELVTGKVRELLDAGLPPSDIAVITPYSAQVRLLRQMIKEDGLEIDSVDGFQGREKEAVVISLVRSNSDGEIGFLRDIRRMNVALTRARRKLIVIGDSATLSAHPFYTSLFDYFDDINAYHTVWEEK